MKAIVNYIKDSREELRKVSWPTKKQTTNATILVIVVSVAIAAFLGALDYGMNQLLEYLLETF